MGITQRLEARGRIRASPGLADRGQGPARRLRPMENPQVQYRAHDTHHNGLKMPGAPPSWWAGSGAPPMPPTLGTTPLPKMQPPLGRSRAASAPARPPPSPVAARSAPGPGRRGHGSISCRAVAGARGRLGVGVRSAPAAVEGGRERTTGTRKRRAAGHPGGCSPEPGWEYMGCRHPRARGGGCRCAGWYFRARLGVQGCRGRYPRARDGGTGGARTGGIVGQAPQRQGWGHLGARAGTRGSRPAGPRRAPTAPVLGRRGWAGALPHCQAGEMLPWRRAGNACSSVLPRTHEAWQSPAARGRHMSGVILRQPGVPSTGVCAEQGRPCTCTAEAGVPPGARGSHGLTRPLQPPTKGQGVSPADGSLGLSPPPVGSLPWGHNRCIKQESTVTHARSRNRARDTPAPSLLVTQGAAAE